MDAILDFLNASSQSSLFPVAQAIGLAIAIAAPLLVLLCVSSDDLRADIREAMRHAGVSSKALAIDLGVTESLLSRKFSGEKALTLDTLAAMPDEFWRWFAISLAHRCGTPALVTSGARLARRQARMSLSHKNGKAGVA